MLRDFVNINGEKGKFTSTLELIPNEDFYISSETLPKDYSQATMYNPEFEVILANVSLSGVSPNYNVGLSEVTTSQYPSFKCATSDDQVLKEKDKDNASENPFLPTMKGGRFLTSDGKEAIIFSSDDFYLTCNINNSSELIKIPKGAFDFFENNLPTFFLPGYPVNVSERYGIDYVHVRNMASIIKNIKSTLWPDTIEGWKDSDLVLLTQKGKKKIIETWEGYHKMLSKRKEENKIKEEKNNKNFYNY